MDSFLRSLTIFWRLADPVGEFLNLMTYITLKPKPLRLTMHFTRSTTFYFRKSCCDAPQWEKEPPAWLSKFSGRCCTAIKNGHIKSRHQLHNILPKKGLRFFEVWGRTPLAVGLRLARCYGDPSSTAYTANIEGNLHHLWRLYRKGKEITGEFTKVRKQIWITNSVEIHHVQENPERGQGASISPAVSNKLRRT